MRFSFDVNLLDKNIKIPLTYRKDVASLIKEALKQENPVLFDNYYGKAKKNKQKPFTFSVHIPNLTSIELDKKKYFALQDDYIRVYFSTNDYSLLTSIYNGLLKVKAYKLFQSSIKLKRFHFKKDIDFTETTMVFRTYSPVVLRSINNKKGKGYLSYDSDVFKKQLQYSTKNLVSYFLKKDIALEEIQFQAIKMKKDILPLYGGEIGNTGIFSLTAPIEVLKLVYDLGFGVKRSQGFGMIDVLG